MSSFTAGLLPASEDRPSISVGSDIPILPPKLMLGSMLLCALLHFVVYGWDFLPAPKPVGKWNPASLLQVLLPSRSGFWRAGFVAACAVLMALMLRWSDSALKQADSGIAFTPVGGIANTGPFALSRNPLYVSWLLLVIPAFAVAIDSLWVFAIAWPVAAAYLHCWVIPVEEAFLEKHFGAECLEYKKAVPRYLLCF